MFGKQATRLLRERWKNATLLAEELFALFQDDIPLSHDAPVTINNHTAGPALTLRNGTPLPGVTVGTGADGAPLIKLGDFNGGDLLFQNQDGGLTWQGPSFFFQPTDPATGLPSGAPVDLGSGGGGGGGGGGGLVGRVVSGAGASYTVDLYANGLSAAATSRVTVTVPAIDPAEVIPAGTVLVPVVPAGGNYYHQPAVWA